MSHTPEQFKKLKRLASRANELGANDGLFQPEPGKGMSLEQAALESWQAGYIPAPSVEALLEALERSIEKHAPPADQ